MSLPWILIIDLQYQSQALADKFYVPRMLSA